MKVGQIFDLPDTAPHDIGHRGDIKDPETQTRILARYEVIKVGEEIKGKVIVTYGFGGARERRHHNNKGYRQIKNGRTRKDAKRLTKKYIKND